ncbi:MAG: uracil-DNA glycosylase family protein [Cyclobacteriaceae bacterium]|jgi:hypothetical protein
MWDDRILGFLSQLRFDARLPKGFAVMNPYRDLATLDVCRKFYGQFYHDDHPRTLMLGINPGRFGSGVTGISFTDPVKLEQNLGITNPFAKKPELSSDFIYRMIDAYGGPRLFYGQFFVSALSPLGFLLNGKNVNYYDDARLEKAATPFIIRSVEQLLGMGPHREVVFCIGEGENLRFLTRLNETHGWFGRLVGLPHPRFVMQYRRKRLAEFIDLYLRALRP